MSRAAVIFALLLQVLYLAYLAIDREILLSTGDTIRVQTTPVDPQDLFRGDYVTLSYEMNAVDRRAVRGSHIIERTESLEVPGRGGGGGGSTKVKPGLKVFAVLEPVPGSTGLSRLSYLTDSPPENELFIAGRTRNSWRVNNVENGVAVSYDIERLFVEQGSGRDIEDKRGRRGDLQVPMEIELAVDSRGRAAIRDYRWSPLGVAIEVDGIPRPGRATPNQDGDETEERTAVEVRFEIQNVSEQDWWLLDPGDHCSFELHSSTWGGPALNKACGNLTVATSDLRRLRPGESYRVSFDLAAPRWQAWEEGQPQLLTELDRATNRRFRIIYRPDPAWATDLSVPSGELWLADLPGQAFSVFGAID